MTQLAQWPRFVDLSSILGRARSVERQNREENNIQDP